MTPVVDDWADYVRLDHQLPDAQHAFGRRAGADARSAHKHAAVFVDRLRVSGRNHAATVRSEHSLRRSCPPRPPNFTRAFVGMSCQDYAGAGNPADFDYFEYHGREFSAAPYRSSLQADTLNSFQERTR
jgi:hypothetical protein